MKVRKSKHRRVPPRERLLNWAAALGAALALGAGGIDGNGSEWVTVNPAIRYQTIRSWGAPSGLIGNPELLLGPILDELAHTLGLTRLRFEPPRREWEDALNDDGDPFHAVEEAFRKAGTDERVRKIFLPFKQRVEREGEHFEFYVSPSFFDGGSSGSAPAWLLDDPGEYAEWAITFLEYLRSRYNLEADFYSICNEAGNNNAFSAAVVSTMIKTLAPRLEALGFRTRIQFPECVSADTSWNYIQSTQGDAELWRHVGLVSYHLYGGNGTRPQIRDFAWARQLPTGQTEYMGLTLDRLYEDLTLGGVSTWEFYALNDLLTLNSTRTGFSRNQVFWQTRQVLRFVRPGAMRVEAACSTNAVRALAFAKDGWTTVVLINTTDGVGRTVDLAGLTPGTYARSQTIGSSSAQELGLMTVSNANPVTLTLPANSTLTAYRFASDFPPTVTMLSASPPFLKLPASSTTLTAAATEPENRSLSYAWSVLDSPPDARTFLATPGNPTCLATGLVSTGKYLFEVEVRRGSHSVTRRLPVQVFSGNQPPELLDVHNRLPVRVMLPTDSTTLRCGGRDLDDTELRYQWSVGGEPPGGSATLLSPTNAACVATNLSVPGAYTFRIELRDPTHMVFTNLVVTVHASNRAPVISNIGASPASLTLPESRTTLSAAASDPDGDVVSHWWAVNSAPAGAIPVVSSPGSNVASVAGLIVPGTYSFKLSVVDRAAVASRNVNVTVNVGSSPPLLWLASPNGGETYVGRQNITIRWSSWQAPGNVRIEYTDGEGGQTTIADSTPNDGLESWTLPHGNREGCRVRISAAGSGTPSDESDTPFSIRAATPRLNSLWLTNATPTLQFEQERGMANLVQRRESFSPEAWWQTVASLSNAAQTVTWTDYSASNLPAAFYRISTQ